MVMKLASVVIICLACSNLVRTDDGRFGHMLDKAAAEEAKALEKHFKESGLEKKEFLDKGLEKMKDVFLGHEEFSKGIPGGAEKIHPSLFHSLGEKKESSPEKAKFIVDLLKTTFEHELKEGHLKESEVTALVTYVTKLLESGILLKKEDTLIGETGLKESVWNAKAHSGLHDALGTEELEMKKFLFSEDPLHDKLEGKDVKSYLAESVGQMAKVGDIDLMKAITETKAKLAAEPYDKLHAQDEMYLKALLADEEGAHAGGHLKMEDILKKAIEGMKGAGEEAFIDEKHFTVPFMEKGLPHLEVSEKDHALKEEMSKHFFSGDEAALEKHKSHHEEAVTHKKDFIYDELLKHEEDHAYGDVFEAKISPETGKDKAIIETKFFSADAALKTDTGLRDFDISKKEGVDEAFKTEETKGIVAKEEGTKDLLKEEGAYVAGGTRAYEKARDQAHVDAKIPSIAKEEDHLLGEELYKKLFSAGVEGGKLHGEKDKVGVSIEKDKTLIGKEGSRKFFEEHDIGSSLAKEGKSMFDAKSKEEDILKDGVLLTEDHFKHGAAEEDHLKETGAAHKTFHEERVHAKHLLKSKLLGFLKHILRMQKCHLVNMPPSELLGIIDCVSRSKNPLLCEKYAICEKKKPIKVILAQEKCQKETIPEKMLRCSTLEPLFPSKEIPLKIFQCVAKSIHELSPVEKKQMIDFEECARQIKVESCGRIPWG